MKQYLDLASKILTEGNLKGDRTGTGTLSIFGHQMRFPLKEGFPLITTKEIHLKSIIYELIWFLNGDTNLGFLHQHNVNIWNEWADKNGDLGPVYGFQWRNWPTHDGRHIDQIQQIIDQIKTTPDSRRIIISAWNVADLPDESISPQQNVAQGKMALAPCHAFVQFYVADGKLSCQLYQRSADTMLGVPFNVGSYALLTHMVAQQCDMDVGDLVWTGGDVHIYRSHEQQIKLQLTREPRHLPKLIIKRKPESIFDYQYDDFEIVGYDPHPHIKAPISV